MCAWLYSCMRLSWFYQGSIEHQHSITSATCTGSCIGCIWLYWNHLITLLETDRAFFIESHLKWNHLCQSCNFGRIYYIIYTHIRLRNEHSYPFLKKFKLTWGPYKLDGSKLRIDCLADFMTIEKFLNSIKWNKFLSQQLEIHFNSSFLQKAIPILKQLEFINTYFLRI